MIYLSQRDPRWANLKIGASNLTVGSYGCTLTCISMILSYFGDWRSPAAISTNANWFTKDGLVNWLKIPFFAWREYGRNDVKILAALKDPKQAVILEVPLPKGGKHWLVAKRKALLSNDYVCQDPWTGKEVNAVKTYGAIAGSAFFLKK